MRLSFPLFRTNPTHGNHIAALDGVRGFAMLLVFLSHASNVGMDLIPGLNFGGQEKRAFGCSSF